MIQAVMLAKVIQKMKFLTRLKIKKWQLPN